MSATRRLPEWARPFRMPPPARCTAGLFVDDGSTNTRSLVGRPLPQAPVRLDDRRTGLLDEALGEGFALLRFDGEPPVNRLVQPLWQRLAPQLVTILTDDRTPPATPISPEEAAPQ